MSSIPGLERPTPIPDPLTKPFWEACNQQRLVLQNCTQCNRLRTHLRRSAKSADRTSTWSGPRCRARAISTCIS